MTFHCTYKVTFPDKGFYYFGKHSTRDLTDGYSGSGRIVRELISSGETFDVELIALHNTNNDAYLHEKLLISDKWKLDSSCINLKPGGRNRFVFGIPRDPSWNRKIGEANRKPRKDKSKVLMAAKLGSEARRGQKDSEETKARRNAAVSQATRGVPKPYLLKVYIVNGETFKGIESVKEKYPLSSPTIFSRMKSEKYPTWRGPINNVTR